jgi:hypothetical protein
VRVEFVRPYHRGGGREVESERLLLRYVRHALQVTHESEKDSLFNFNFNFKGIYFLLFYSKDYYYFFKKIMYIYIS